MRRAAAGWVIALAAAVALGLGGCRTVHGLTTKPQVQSVSVTVVAFDLRKINLRFDVELLNPGDGEITIAGYEYDLHLEGQPFLAGRSNEGFALTPHGTALVPLPVTLIFAELQRKLTALKGRGEASYRLDVTLLADTPLGIIRVPLKKEGCLPLLPVASRGCNAQR